MFLTNFLLRKGIPGHQWIGKKRRPQNVSAFMKVKIVKHLEREAANEYWISRPYLTREQEYFHASERRLQNWLNLKAEKAKNFPKHKYMTDHLSHLRITKNWIN